MKTKTPKQVKAVNAAFIRASSELKRFRDRCEKVGTYFRCVTFRVLDNGETKFHVTYRR